MVSLAPTGGPWAGLRCGLCSLGVFDLELSEKVPRDRHEKREKALPGRYDLASLN